ncbi:YihA family ribosome biogenesis GTP-binding protein [candidate division KSB1 bacterium]|nr:MAG: YihA family ribosome biogenesis GTP-binding protein [candidate division KSB1 bacterium]
MRFKIKKAELIASVRDINTVSLKKIPKFAFAGRSNTGKSSLINHLLNRKNLAKISSTPGKTRTIDFYEINNDFYFVDLPGYGYAKLSKKKKNEWKFLIESYFKSIDKFNLVFILIDSRKGITEYDRTLIEWLESLSISYTIVFTKTDKISGNELSRNLKKLKMEVKKGYVRVIKYSIFNNEGRKELWNEILGNL